MPIFEYKCADCGEEFEELVFGDDKPACPKCSSNNTNKLMSCCRFGSGGGSPITDRASSPSAGSGCAGCSGGDCSSCG